MLTQERVFNSENQLWCVSMAPAILKGCWTISRVHLMVCIPRFVPLLCQQCEPHSTLFAVVWPHGFSVSTPRSHCRDGSGTLCVFKFPSTSTASSRRGGRVEKSKKALRSVGKNKNSQNSFHAIIAA